MHVTLDVGIDEWFAAGIVVNVFFVEFGRFKDLNAITVRKFNAKYS